jgi:predicted ribosomally synthesized peptide with SipW-like signal peptide
MRKAGDRKRNEVSKKLALSMLVLATLGLVAGAGTWSAFSDTTDNTGNTFSSGTVVLNDDDGGSTPMFTMAGLTPGGTDSACIVVDYSGSLPANVYLYGATSGTGLDQYLDLKVTRGTKSGGAFDGCGTFSADATNYIGQGAGVVYNGTVQGYPDSFGAALADPPSGGAEVWTTGETHAYRFDVTLQNDNNAQGKNASQTFTWEARNV